MRNVWFILGVLLHLSASAQFPNINGDSARTYLPIRMEYRYADYNKMIPFPVLFNDSLSFYNFLDTAAMEGDTLPEVDFNQFQVIAYSYCMQCIRSCDHELYNHNYCHRNACHYTPAFYKQRRKIREEIVYQTIFIPENMHIGDSIISTSEEWEKQIGKEAVSNPVDFTKQILLARTDGGDCHAYFTHEIYLDHTNKKLVWKLYNHYGGCRSGLLVDFLIQVPKPPDGYRIKFEKILVD